MYNMTENQPKAACVLDFSKKSFANVRTARIFGFNIHLFLWLIPITFFLKKKKGFFI